MRTLILASLCACVVSAPARAQRFLGKSRTDWSRELAGGSEQAKRDAAFALGRLGAHGVEAVPDLVKALNSGTDKNGAPLRDAAAFALGEIAAASGRCAAQVWEKAGPVLVERLKSDVSPQVRRSTAVALGHCGVEAAGALSPLLDVLESDAPAVVRRNAAWAVARVGPGRDFKTAVRGLCDALKKKDDDKTVLHDVVVALGEIGRPRAEPAVMPLVELARATDKPVLRKAAVAALVSLVSPAQAEAGEDENSKLVGVLREALREGDGTSRGLAAAALANVGKHGKPAVKELVALLDDLRMPETTRRNAVVALSRIGADAADATPALGRGLNPVQPVEVRRFAAETLARIGFPTIEGEVKAILKAIESDKDYMTRQRAIWCFLQSPQKIEDVGAVKILEGVLDDRSSTGRVVRYDAARCLAHGLRERASAKTIDVLGEMLKDPGIKVYKKSNTDVKRGTEGTGGSSRVESDLGSDARYMAADALADIGKTAARPEILKSLETLSGLTTVDMEDTRKAAARALEKLK